MNFLPYFTLAEIRGHKGYAMKAHEFPNKIPLNSVIFMPIVGVLMSSIGFVCTVLMAYTLSIVGVLMSYIGFVCTVLMAYTLSIGGVLMPSIGFVCTVLMAYTIFYVLASRFVF